MKKKRTASPASPPRSASAHSTPGFTPLAFVPAVGLSLIILLVYTLTLAPSVSGGDSGELIAVAYRLGVAHPPGYPLYTLLGHVASLVPVASVAQRINFLSALCGAGAAALLALAVMRWSRNVWAGVLAAGLFAFSPLVWRYAVVAEVFALNNLFVAALLYLSVRYAEGPTARRLAGLAFTLGLALCNHHTILFLAACLGPWVIWRGRALGARAWVLAAGVFALGLLPYGYLVWAGPRLEIFSWGDPSHWDSFWRHFLRQEYGTLQLGAEAVEGRGWASFVAYARDLPSETLLLGVPLAAWGARQAYRRSWRRDLVAVLAGAYLFYVIVFHALSNLKIEIGVFREMLTRFWQQPNLLLFAGIGLGFAALTESAPPPSKGAAAAPNPPFLSRLCPAIVIAAIALQLGLHYRAEDQSRNLVIRDYALAHLAAPPPDALVITKGDLVTNGIRYLQAVEGARPDVCNFDQGIIGLSWSAALIRKNCPRIAVPPFGADEPARVARAIIDANVDRIPAYAGTFVLNDGARPCGDGLSCWAQGLMYRVLRENQAPDLTRYIEDDRRMIASLDLARLRDYESRDGWVATVARYYWDSRYRVGYTMVQKGLPMGSALLVTEGVRLLEQVVQGWPGAPAETYKVLGLGLHSLIPQDSTARERMNRAIKTYLGRPESKKDGQSPGLAALMREPA